MVRSTSPLCILKYTLPVKYTLGGDRGRVFDVRLPLLQWRYVLSSSHVLLAQRTVLFQMGHTAPGATPVAALVTLPLYDSSSHVSFLPGLLANIHSLSCARPPFSVSVFCFAYITLTLLLSL